MNLRHVYNRHPGQTAWILGTGKSFDRLDFDSVDGFQIALNRTIGVVPILAGRTYWLAVDHAWQLGVPGPWEQWLQDVRDGNGVTAMFKDRMYGLRGQLIPAPTGPNILHFRTAKRSALDVLSQDRDWAADMNTLYAEAGTACTAVHAAWIMGAKRVVLAGIDGTDGYADRVIQWYTKPHRGGFGYGMAKECTLDVIERLGLDYEDLSKGDDREDVS